MKCGNDRDRRRPERPYLPTPAGPQPDSCPRRSPSGAEGPGDPDRLPGPAQYDMRYWLLVLLVIGLVTVAGYALVQSLQTPQQTIGKAVHQTAERILMLNISVVGLEFPPDSTVHLKATVGNAGTEEVLLEYFAGQLFEVVIKDETGTIVYVHSDRGFQRYLMIAPLHLRLAPGESHTETMKIPLVYTRGAEKDKPLPPGNYTLTVCLTAAVQGYLSGSIDGVKAYTAASIRIMIRPR